MTFKIPSKKIKQWQAEWALTNLEAAERLGVPVRTYSGWKSGRHAPRGRPAFERLRALLEWKEVL